MFPTNILKIKIKWYMISYMNKINYKDNEEIL